MITYITLCWIFLFPPFMQRANAFVNQFTNSQINEQSHLAGGPLFNSPFDSNGNDSRNWGSNRSTSRKGGWDDGGNNNRNFNINTDGSSKRNINKNLGGNSNLNGDERRKINPNIKINGANNLNADFNEKKDSNVSTDENKVYRKKTVTFIDPGLTIPKPPEFIQKKITDFTKLKSKEEIWEEEASVLIQGGSLRTCVLEKDVERVQILMKTLGRPLNSNIYLWQGPDNTPQKLNIYLEEGNERQFRAVIETPRDSNAIAIYNIGNMEFPFEACVDPNVENIKGVPSDSPAQKMVQSSKPRVVQGGATYTTPFPSSVQSAEVMLKSAGRPMNARIELLQGPNNIKQTIHVYVEEGIERPFYAIIDTPGSGNVVRIVNTSSVEYPLSAILKAYEKDSSMDENDIDEPQTGSQDGPPKDNPKLTWS